MSTSVTSSCTNNTPALFATQMFDTLGVDWAGSLLGFLGIAFMPIPFLFYIFGERLRKHSSYAPTDFGKKKDDEENRDGTFGEVEERKSEEQVGGESGGSSTALDV